MSCPAGDREERSSGLEVAEKRTLSPNRRISGAAGKKASNIGTSSPSPPKRVYERLRTAWAFIPARCHLSCLRIPDWAAAISIGSAAVMRAHGGVRVFARPSGCTVFVRAGVRTMRISMRQHRRSKLLNSFKLHVRERHDARVRVHVFCALAGDNSHAYTRKKTWRAIVQTSKSLLFCAPKSLIAVSL